MKNGKKHIDDLFREKLGDYVEAPPSDAWSELDTRLDTITPPAVPRAPYRWLGHVGMVSVIAVLSVSVFTKYIGGKKDAASTSYNSQEISNIETSNKSGDVGVETNGAKEVEVPGIAETAAPGNEQNLTESANEGAEVNERQSSPGKSGGAIGLAYHSSRGSRSKGKAVLFHTVAPTATGEQGNEPHVSENVLLSSSLEGEERKIDNQSVTLPGSNLKSERKLPLLADAKPMGKNVPDKMAAAKERANIDFPRWGAGVKVGYERGFDNIAAKKLAVAPYVQYNLSRKVSVMVQPAVKFANSATRTISSRNYYKANDDGQVATVENYIEPRAEGGIIDTYHYSRFRYTRSHDSIVKSEKIGGQYMEFELPVLMRYTLTKSVSVYGGMNMIYSKLSGVKEGTYSKNIVTSIDTLMSARSVNPTPAPVNDIISYSGTPISDYNGPLYPSSQVNHLRFGAMVGVTYEYSNRWLLDAMVQQNPAPRDMKGAFNVNAPLSSTYFRLSVGYKLTK